MSFSTITSAKNPLVKHWKSLLQDKDYRYQEKKLIIEGKKLVQEISKHSPLLRLMTKKEMEIEAKEKYLIPEDLFNKISPLKNPEGVMAEIKMPENRWKKMDRLLVLEEINDPGNLGTLFRTALAFNWDGLFLLGSSCDPFNDKVVRASKGACLLLPFQEGSLLELQDLLQKEKLSLYAGDMEGKSFENKKFSDRLALVLGNEAKGLSDEVKKKSEKITIPMNVQSESLNVAVAGAIFLYFLRQT